MFLKLRMATISELKKLIQNAADLADCKNYYYKLIFMIYL